MGCLLFFSFPDKTRADKGTEHGHTLLTKAGWMTNRFGPLCVREDETSGCWSRHTQNKEAEHQN